MVFAPAPLSIFHSFISTAWEKHLMTGALPSTTRTMIVAIVPLAVSLIGCGRPGAGMYAVSGTVTWQGQPVPKGDIVFIPIDGAVAPDAAKIIDGKYRLMAKAGKKRVEIHAAHREGRIDPAMGEPPARPYIPSRFNSKSVLTAEIRPDGSNVFDFNLTDNEGKRPQ
jgi:hypothetical protein